MSDPSRPRPVPGPPRPGPGALAGRSSPEQGAAGSPAVGGGATDEPAPSGGQAFADLGQRPVAEHVAIFDAELSRLQRELSTIDRL